MPADLSRVSPERTPAPTLPCGRIIAAPKRLRVVTSQPPADSGRSDRKSASPAGAFLIGLMFATGAAYGALFPHGGEAASEYPEVVDASRSASDRDPDADQGSIHSQARKVAQHYLKATYHRAVYVERMRTTPAVLRETPLSVQAAPVSGERKMSLQAAQKSSSGRSPASKRPEDALRTYRPELPKSSRSALTQRVLKIIQLHSPKHKDPKQLAERIVRESLAQDYDPLFVAAVVKSESGFNALARSHVGARGLMQIMPKTGAYLADKLNVRKVQLYDTEQNLRLGIAFLKELEAGYGGDKVMTLVAYNWGPGHVESAGKGKRRIPGDVMRYAVKILNDYRRWRGEVPVRTAVG